MVLFRTLLDKSVEKYLKMVHYLCRNVLQVEFAFCLAKADASLNLVHRQVSM
jgi:hypothetical protein